MTLATTAPALLNATKEYTDESSNDGYPQGDINHKKRGAAQAVCQRISIPEIAGRLNIGRLAVYEMLKSEIIPAIRIGRRWIVTRQAYEQWERTCGMRSDALLGLKPEVSVVN